MDPRKPPNRRLTAALGYEFVGEPRISDNYVGI